MQLEVEETGQIKLNTPFGNKLYELCRNNPTIKTVVEIGTWKGLGSTQCLIQGLVDSNKSQLNFISLEANAAMYDIANNAWKRNLPDWAKLVYGRIIEIDEMDNFQLGTGHPDEQLWFDQDKQAFTECPNVISLIPKKIDFLFLDGGEFSTYAEYLKLKNRSVFVGMDDTTSRKCKLIRKEILANTSQYEILLDNPWYRNGVMIYKNNAIL